MKINKRIIFGVVFVDQIAKFALTRQNFFTLKVVENPGLPFGTNLGFFNFILLLLVLGVFILWGTRFFSVKDEIGVSLILGGAVSNLFDRLIGGTVTDFINVGISTLNFADIAIFIGIMSLLFNLCCKKSILPR